MWCDHDFDPTEGLTMTEVFYFFHVTDLTYRWLTEWLIVKAVLVYLTRLYSLWLFSTCTPGPLVMAKPWRTASKNPLVSTIFHSMQMNETVEKKSTYLCSLWLSWTSSEKQLVCSLQSNGLMVYPLVYGIFWGTWVAVLVGGWLQMVFFYLLLNFVNEMYICL